MPIASRADAQSEIRHVGAGLQPIYFGDGQSSGSLAIVLLDLDAIEARAPLLRLCRTRRDRAVLLTLSRPSRDLTPATCSLQRSLPAGARPFPQPITVSLHLPGPRGASAGGAS